MINKLRTKLIIILLLKEIIINTPAPKVTLIKSGLSSANTPKVSSILSSSVSFLGGKISKERLLLVL